MIRVIKVVKRIFIFGLMIFILMVNVSFASNKNGKNLNKETISSDLIKSPLYLYAGDFLVIGDSYAYLMVENTSELYNFIVRPGYNITKIYFELLPRIKADTFKYAFLFLGPNDYMEQLEPDKFKFVLGLVVDELEAKGIKVIMTDYIEPHYNYKVYSNLINSTYTIDEYNIGVKEIILGRNLLYVPMEHLMNMYGYSSESDLVHPNDKLYEPLLGEVKGCIDRNIVANIGANAK